MGIRDDSKKLGRDAIGDAIGIIREWLPAALRFVVLQYILRHIVGMDHRAALEVGALLAFADTARARPQGSRFKTDVKTLFRKDGSIRSQDLKIDEQEESKHD